MQPTISIIVPVYNVENYISKCLGSIINQTEKNIEILVIDDGSTDNSGVICDTIEKSDPRVRVFHKNNGGLSSARNFGIDMARGQYIGFVDGDDYISPDMYETLLRLARDNNADMSMCALYDVFGEKIRKINSDINEIVVEKEDAIKMVFEAKIVSVTAVNKLYKKTLFDDVRYPIGKTAEDAFVIVDLLSRCNKVAITSAQKYYYIHRRDSITTRTFNGNIDAIRACERNYRIIEQHFPGLLDLAKMRLCLAHFFILDRLLLDDKNEFGDIKRRVISYLNSNTLFVLRNKQFHMTRKMSAILLKINWRLYKICIFLQNRRYPID